MSARFAGASSSSVWGIGLLEEAAVGRDQMKRPTVREREQEVAGVGGVDQAQPEEPALRLQHRPDDAVDQHQIAGLARIPVPPAVARRNSIVEREVAQHDHALVGIDKLRQRVDRRADHQRPCEALPELMREAVVRVRMIPEKPAFVRRQRELVGEGLARRDAQPDVVAVPVGGDVQPVEVEVGRLRQPVREAQADGVTGAGFDQRSGQDAVVGPELCRPATDLDGRGLCLQVDLDQPGPWPPHARRGGREQRYGGGRRHRQNGSSQSRSEEIAPAKVRHPRAPRSGDAQG